MVRLHSGIRSGRAAVFAVLGRFPSGEAMPEFQFQEMFPSGKDTTTYRKLSSDFVGTTRFNGKDVLTIEPEALTLLTAQAFKDISHLLRPGHLQQLSAILDDREASTNDKYVAL